MHRRIYGFSPPDITDADLDHGGAGDEERNPRAMALEIMLRIVLRGFDIATRKEVGGLLVQLRGRFTEARSRASDAPAVTREVLAEWETMADTIQELIDELPS